MNPPTAPETNTKFLKKCNRNTFNCTIPQFVN